MAEDARPVAVTSGGREVRYVKVTELTGQDISGDTVTACVAPLGTVPGEDDFATPTSTDFEEVDGVHSVIVGVLVTGDNATAGQEYVVWAKLDDSPELPAIAAPVSFPVI
jgi:hypothetical protein